MDLKLFATIAGTVFLAELGDKTQLATMLFAADRTVSKWTVFAGSATALVAAAGLGVLVGEALSRVVEPRMLSLGAGAGFMVIGAWTMFKAW